MENLALSTKETDKDFELTLTISPRRMSRDAFLAGRFNETLYFTNNSKAALEFITNGSNCFQFVDIVVVDQNGKNHAPEKFGDGHIITLEANKKYVVHPGERVGGTFSLWLVVRGQISPGTYRVQAFLTYEDLKVSSNIVQLVIYP